MNVHNISFGKYLYLRTDFFPDTKHTKNKIRTIILDEHFENTTSIKTDIDELISKKKKQAFSLKIVIFFSLIYTF